MIMRKEDLPLRANAPQNNQIVQDVENAPADDPVFVGAAPPGENLSEGDLMVQEFMETTQRLKEIELLLLRRQKELREYRRELEDMVRFVLERTVSLQ